MNEEVEEQSRNDNNSPSYGVISELGALHPDERGTAAKTNPARQSPSKMIRKNRKGYFLRFCRVGPDRHIELLIALVVAGLVWAQWNTSGKIARIVQSTQRSTQRPYVASDGVILQRPDHNGIFRIEQLWKNYGQTTAVKMTIKYEFGPNLPNNWRHTFSALHHELHSDLVGGSDTNAYDFISPAALADQEASTGTTYVWGRINYQDAFDGVSSIGAVEHVAEYCIELRDLTSSPGETPTSPRPYRWGYVQGCGVDHPDGGTCFDQGCQDYPQQQ